MAAIEPMEQFLIHKVWTVPAFMVPGIGRVDRSVTNSVLTMIGAAAAISLLLLFSARRAVVPGRLQAFGEILYDLVDKGLTGPMIGDRGRPFLPYVFALFSIIAALNIWGLVPGTFTVTSQLAVTVTLALMTFIIVLIVGFARNGLGFFKLFVPGGVHWVMLLILVPIEFVSFMVRPVTLSMRLFGNIYGGEVALGVMTALTIAFIPVGLIGLEVMLNAIQALIFSVLTLMFIVLAIESHEHEEGHIADQVMDAIHGPEHPALQPTH